MRQNINFTILFLLVLTIGSCKKSFLDVGNKSTVLRQEYVTNLAATKEFLNGVYITLSKDFYQGYNQIYPELIADNIRPVSFSLTSHYTWSQQSDLSTDMDVNVNRIWLYGYQIIRSCNFALEKALEYRNQNPGDADNISAHAYAIRALVHFVLVNIYAQSYNFTTDASHPGIPYVITSDWTMEVTRNTVSQVYENMINDLNTAIQLFQNSSNSTLLMSPNAAKALLSRIFLFKGDYSGTKNMALSVISQVPIMPRPHYPLKLFTPGESEALFQLLPTVTYVNDGTYATDYQGKHFYNGNATEFLASEDISAILKQDPMDVRSAWISSNGSGNDTIRKFPVNVIPGFYPISASYYPTILRSSELYLAAAEAYARINNEDSARYYLDAIRTRANPAATQTNAAGQSLLDTIFLERRKELAFEGLRMFDLLRWKKDVNRINPPDPSAQSLPYPDPKAVAPLPGRDVNPKVPQNPGY